MAEPRPDMNIQVAPFTVTHKLYNTSEKFKQVLNFLEKVTSKVC